VEATTHPMDSWHTQLLTGSIFPFLGCWAPNLIYCLAVLRSTLSYPDVFDWKPGNPLPPAFDKYDYFTLPSTDSTHPVPCCLFALSVSSHAVPSRHPTPTPGLHFPGCLEFCLSSTQFRSFNDKLSYLEIACGSIISVSISCRTPTSHPAHTHIHSHTQRPLLGPRQGLCLIAWLRSSGDLGAELFHVWIALEGKLGLVLNSSCSCKRQDLHPHPHITTPLSPPLDHLASFIVSMSTWLLPEDNLMRFAGADNWRWCEVKANAFSLISGSMISNFSSNSPTLVVYLISLAGVGRKCASWLELPFAMSSIMRRFPHAQAKILTSVNATRERAISPTIKSTETRGAGGRRKGDSLGKITCKVKCRTSDSKCFENTYGILYFS